MYIIHVKCTYKAYYTMWASKEEYHMIETCDKSLRWLGGPHAHMHTVYMYMHNTSTLRACKIILQITFDFHFHVNIGIFGVATFKLC